MKNNGYLYVASVNKAFYYAAKESALSLLDFYPEAKITFFTHAEWVEDEDYDIFDNIVTNIPVSIRAKLWALPRTPYEKTLYIDADTYIQHEDISKVFDLLGDNNLLFTKIRPYNAKLTQLSETEEMTLHCGLVLYDNASETLKLMQNWYDGFIEQQKYGYDTKHYPESVVKWDTFTMWKLLTDKKYNVKVGVFPNPDARWNFVNGYKYEELQGEDIVIYHTTIQNVDLKKHELYKAK